LEEDDDACKTEAMTTTKGQPEAIFTTTQESDFQMLPSGALSAIRVLPDTPKIAKLDPVVVKETDPDFGALVFNVDIFGALYVKCIDRTALDASSALETSAFMERPAPLTALQLMPESDFQIDTKDALPPNTTFMLVENEPIFAPSAVTELQPVAAVAYTFMEDTDGTSNESTFETLPRREPNEMTESLMYINKLREIFKVMEELAVQQVASVCDEDNAAWGEKPICPKAEPTIVTDDEPLEGALWVLSKTFKDGMSKDIRARKDPYWETTEAKTGPRALLRPLWPTLHIILESETHDSLLDAVLEIRIRGDIEVNPKSLPKIVTLIDDVIATFKGDPEDTTETW
jgi:hypothetical protein